MLTALLAAPGHGYPFFALYEKSYDFHIRRVEGVLSRRKENCLQVEVSMANKKVAVSFVGPQYVKKDILFLANFLSKRKA
jgi:hypothetical protein